MEGFPDHTGTDGVNRDNSSTQVSSEPQRSDAVHCEQGIVQCTESMYLSGII